MIRTLCLICVIYAALCSDLSGRLRTISPLLPSLLDLVFVGLLLGGQRLSAVCGCAATGFLSALVDGTNPGLALIVAATFSVLTIALGRREGSSNLVQWLLPVVAVVVRTVMRAIEYASAGSASLADNPRIWMLAGSASITIAGLCAWLLVMEFAGLGKRREAFES